VDVACSECDEAATLPCPRCREPLCAEHFAAASPWCGLCAAELDERLRVVGMRRVAAVASGALGGGIVSGGFTMMLYGILSWILHGLSPVVGLTMVLLSVLSGVCVGGYAGSRLLDGRERSRFLEEGVPHLPRAQLMK
jgi:hypothetical protein